MEQNRRNNHVGAKGAWHDGLLGRAGAAGAAARLPRGRSDVIPTPALEAASARGTAVVGYASCFDAGRDGSRSLRQQTSVIARECKRRGLELIEVVGEREPATGKGLARPGLAYALDRIQSGAARGLVVAELSRITYSAAELGTIMEWLASLNVRLVAAAHSFDSGCEDGRLAASMLIEVSRWERARLSERTRTGLQAARDSGRSTGRRAVTDDPALSQRITEMRAQGMTLQAIADRLNEEGVPTVRGGAKWRHSSVQAAVGYRRHHRPLPGGLVVSRPPAGQGASQ